jgi:hypothetical protein
MEPREARVVLILADISGYTKFNRDERFATVAIHYAGGAGSLLT